MQQIAAPLGSEVSEKTAHKVYVTNISKLRACRRAEPPKHRRASGCRTATLLNFRLGCHRNGCLWRVRGSVPGMMDRTE